MIIKTNAAAFRDNRVPPDGGESGEGHEPCDEYRNDVQVDEWISFVRNFNHSEYNHLRVLVLKYGPICNFKNTKLQLICVNQVYVQRRP
jgi:hypothetical protein